MLASVISSCSKGNGIVVHNSTTAFGLDAGVSYKEYKKALDYNTAILDFVVVTHGHNDHCQYVKDFLKAGITVYMPQDLKRKYDSYCAVALEPAKRHRHGDYAITPFVVPHSEDVICYAYIVEHPVIGKLLYMVDACYCPYDLSGQKINHFFVECNHTEVDRDAPNFVHSVSGHMGSDTFVDFIRHNATDATQSVILCHMSDSLTDAEEVLDDVQKIVPDGVCVAIAEKGFEIEL